MPTSRPDLRKRLPLARAAFVAFFFLGGIALPNLPARAVEISADGSQAKLRVLSYNAWGVAFAGKKVKQRLPLIARALPKLGADIVAMQEVFEGCFVGNQPAWILRGSQYPYYVEGPSHRGLRCTNAGLLILSKHPIVKAARLVYSACTGIDCLARKGIVFARIAVPGIGEIDVYNTHTNAGDGRQARLRQAYQISRFIEKHSGDGERPIVLAGDLNAEPDSEEIAHLKQDALFRDSYEEYFRDRDATPVERNGFTSDPRRNPYIPARERSKRIDYVLIREAKSLPGTIAVENAKLAFEEPGYRGLPLSDHYGVQTDFSFALRR